MAPILSAEAELDLSVPLSLATLSDHFGTVNCVRWSSDGHRLASASDDRLVMIHERKEGPPVAVFGSTEQPDIERWQLGLSCRGHTSDVVSFQKKLTTSTSSNHVLTGEKMSGDLTILAFGTFPDRSCLVSGQSPSCFWWFRLFG